MRITSRLLWAIAGVFRTAASHTNSGVTYSNLRKLQRIFDALWVKAKGGES